MAAIDPFASIAELCSLSSSQEEYLRRSRFALEPPPDSPIPFLSDSSQDAASADLRLESTPIRMESLPETPVEENQPEDSPGGGVQATSGGAGNDDDSDKDTVVIGGGSSEEDSAAVDLSRDTYPLFSIEPESESTERIESQDKVILCNSEEPRVLDGELGFGDGGVCKPLITVSRNSDKVGGSGISVSEKKWKGLTRCLGLLQSVSEKREGSSSCCRTPLLRTPQSNLGSDPALVVQRSIVSLQKLGSPLKGLATASEKQGGNFSKSMFLQTSEANLGIDPALVLQRSLEKMGSTTKERKQGPESVQAVKRLASAIAIEHTDDGKSEAAQRGSAAKRKLEYVGEGFGSNAAAETNVLENVEHMTTSQGDTSLPRSGKRAKEPSRSSPEVATLLGLLNIFAAKEPVRDSKVESMSLIDICKMHGMTFP
ncbi:unnamed protein product [Linum tenue]|uniref:Uncharacterized protein n=1 Tax=Linum tenue TaxID=586396 RepID=A0AAV0LUV9_9ROSI|nr:unnamed protein product [Linum tenue]